MGKKLMKNFALPVVLFFLLSGADLFASARQESTSSGESINNEYVLSITYPNVSSLSVERQVVGDSVVRYLVTLLNNVEYRIRTEEEIIYYRDSAWNRSRNEIHNNLVNRRNERDLIIYRGDAAWRTQNNLRDMDQRIESLEAELLMVNSNPPIVNERPAFSLCASNRNGIFPAPPLEGREGAFLEMQNANAFLKLDFYEYHERIFLEVKLYATYSSSYIYQDSILFSLEDINSAVDELGWRLAEVISGTRASMLLVRAEPEESIIIVNNRFIGLGSGEYFSFSPGNIELVINANNHVPARIPLAMNAGELTDLSLRLTPYSYSEYHIDVPGHTGARVYWGNYFVGEAPLTLALPRYPYVYLNVESPSGEIGSAVIRNNELVSGRVEFNGTSTGGEINFRTWALPEQNRVERARRDFYIAYGAFWIVLPTALITRGIANSHIMIGDYSYESLRTGADVAWISSLGYTLFQMFRYLYISGTEAEPNVRMDQ